MEKELEFINAEKDFDFSWLPENLEQPDSIGSENLQTALDCFCDEASDFLLPRFPEHETFIRSALHHGKSFRELDCIDNDCPKHLKELAYLIVCWLCEVFWYQKIVDVYSSLDVSFLKTMPKDILWMIENRSVTDIPRRAEAMKRLREMWASVPPDLRPEDISREYGRVDMRDWDEKHLKEAEAA